MVEGEGESWEESSFFLLALPQTLKEEEEELKSEEIRGENRS